MRHTKRLLDLFCCEGGASTGYARAGFRVYGVDLFKHTDEHGRRRGFDRRRYPFSSHQGDALAVLTDLLAGKRVTFTAPDGTTEDLGLEAFSAITASPPCQAYSITKHSHSNEHPQLIEPVRTLLQLTGKPYIIENVPGAPLLTPLTLCGTEYHRVAEDLDGTRLYLRRHRLFESNIYLYGNGGCQCRDYERRGYSCAGAYGGGSADRAHARHVRRGGYTPSKPIREALLGIDWMTLGGLSQSIPPAYTEHLGIQLLDYVTATEEGHAA